MVFLMAVSQVSNSRCCLSDWARMDNLKPSQNWQIRTASFRDVMESNSLTNVCQCFKCTVSSKTSFNWYYESFQIVLYIISTKAFNSSRLWQRKAFNSSEVIGIWVLSASLRWCCYQRNRAWFFKNVGAKSMRFGFVASAVAKWSSHCLQKL